MMEMEEHEGERKKVWRGIAKARGVGMALVPGKGKSKVTGYNTGPPAVSQSPSGKMS
jgi:hypothetical protein